MGQPLPVICLFVSGSGLSFCIGLRLWEHVARHQSIISVLLLTFFLELTIVALASQTSATNHMIVPLAIANGFYNCFFWTTQRCLFLQLVTSSNSGRQYGNLQIFVSLFLKAGILFGGLLLETDNFLWIFLLSASLTLAMAFYFYHRNHPQPIMQIRYEKSIDLKSLIQYRDPLHSRRIFVIDGLFLFLESHLWTISLFLISNQNFASFGIVVIVLAALFGVVFFTAKNTIDRVAGSYLFQLAVLLYCAGWSFRIMLSEETSAVWMVSGLLLITFCTSFFRLVFNKRFFDIANATSGNHYLIVKSYYTQMAVFIVFLLLAILTYLIADERLSLQIIYGIAAVASLVYFYYRRPTEQLTSSTDQAITLKPK